ncbi:MAG: TonB-dependent receptor family protein [Longimicrobiales bacterium]
MPVSGVRRRLLLLTVVLLRGSPADAQQPAASDTIALEPITVTVLRTPLALHRVPYAIAVRAAEAAAPALSLAEQLRGIPGVQVDNRYNDAVGDRISVRGFGARAQFGVRGVRVLVDGVPATLPDGQSSLSHVDPAAIERVEVVRGAASALYGNAAGGVIQLERWRSVAATAAELDVRGGADGLARATGRLLARAGDLDYRLEATRRVYDGFRAFSRSEKLHAGAGVSFERGSRRARLSFDLVDYDARNPGALSATQLETDRTQAHTANIQQNTGEAARQAQLGGGWSEAVGIGVLELSGYALTREVDNPIPPRIIVLDRAAGGVRAALRSAAAAGLAWGVGAELELQRDDRVNFVNDGGARGQLVLDQRERVRAAALFAQALLPLGAASDLLASARYDRFRFHAADQLIGADDPDDSGTRTMQAFSPAAGIVVRPSATARVFANVSTAFETPTTSELANRPTGAGGFNPELQPQRTVSVELGGSLTPRRRGNVDVTVYYARVRDALIPFEVPDLPGRQFYRNAGSTTHRGVELGVDARLPRALELRLAYALTDVRFDRYVVAGVPRDGNRVPGIAPHRVDISAGWRHRSGLRLALEQRLEASTPVDDANSAESHGYALTHVRITQHIRLGDLAIDPFVVIENIFDAEYNSSVVVNAFGSRFFEPGPGRSLFLGLRARVGN